MTFDSDRRRRDLEVIDRCGEHADRLVVAALERDLLIWEDDRTRRFRLTARPAATNFEPETDRSDAPPTLSLVVVNP